MKYLAKLLPLAILLEISILIIAFIESKGDVTLYFQHAARLSARISLLYFTILFVYATINESLGSHSKALQTKYIMARNFMIVHLVHWVLLAVAVSRSGFELKPLRIVAGAMAYIMIIALPFILKGKVMKTLPLKWVMPTCLTYVWFIFFMTYLSRVNGTSTQVSGSMTSYVILIMFTSLLMVWRVLVVIMNSRLRSKPVKS